MPLLMPNASDFYFSLNVVCRDPSEIAAADSFRLNGLGFVLLQMVNGTWKPVQASSRFLTPANICYDRTGSSCCLLGNAEMQHISLGPTSLHLDYRPSTSSSYTEIERKFCCRKSTVTTSHNENAAFAYHSQMD